MQLPVLAPHAGGIPRATDQPARTGSRVLTDAERAEVARDLANAVAGEVRFGLHDRMLYSTDASLYQVEPIGVVVPADVEDAARAGRFCVGRGLPILPRGGGTSLAGQCTNRAVVIDLSPNCRKILEVDAARGRARVEPGITVDDLNDELARMGGGAARWFFAPDPATSRHANVGGCIGNNAAGARSIRYGRTSESLLGVEVLLASGERVRLEEGAALRDARVRELTVRVLEVVLPLAGVIRARFPKTIRRNAGYALDMIVDQALRGEPGGSTGPTLVISDAMLSRVNLAHLICGSEGTLGLVLGAEVRLHERPGARGLAVLGFESLDDAIAAVGPILATGPTAVELLDDLVIGLARANTEYARYVDLMPAPKAGKLNAVLYVEYSGANASAVASKFDELAKLATSLAGKPSMQAHTDATAMLNAWKLRKAGEPLLHGIPGRRKPITFVEDNAVPVEHLSRFVKEFRGIVERHGTRAAFWAHASVGVLHVRPLMDLHDEGDRRRVREIAIEVADLARGLGGVMSGEHGDGRVRGPLLERFFGAEIMSAFGAVKRNFDPQNLFNPGNIVPWEGDPRPIESITEKLRIEPAPGHPVGVPEVETYFDYSDAHGFDGAVEMCNGAGVCRKKQGGTMCPSYMATLDERHSTRGRANALRLAITGQLDGAAGEASWDDEETRRTLDLCLSCKACKTECPSNVDVARLKAEYTAQRYRRRGVPLAARVMGSIRAINRMGSVWPSLANWLGGSRLGRLGASRVLGIDARRSLPRFAPSLARMWGRGAREEEGRSTVVLFGDCFTMFNEPGIGLATRQVMEACGYRVVLADAGCCERAKISLGLLGEAIGEIDATIGRLIEVVEAEGARAILVAEPSCLSAIKDDWLSLKLNRATSDRRRLAGMAFLPEEFLEKKWSEHPRRPEFEPLDGHEGLIVHGHCHQKALWGVQTSAAPLQRASGNPSRVRVLDSGCCGMAGSFGYTRERFDLSSKIGEQVLLPAVRAAEPGTQVVAPGTSCRHQIHDATGVRAWHPIEVLAQRLRG